MEALLKDSTHMRVRHAYIQRNGCSRNRVGENGNRSEEELGGGESRV